MAKDTDKGEIAALLRGAKLVPVLTIERVADAVPLARALVAGGVRVLEITLRTAAGFDAAVAVRREVPEAVAGLGTAVTAADIQRAKQHDLRFCFSPGVSVELLTAARETEMPFVPGIGTASELMLALTHGFTTVKLFPAEQLGGIGALKAFAGPFPEARFCPTGGVTEANCLDYLAQRNVVAVGGSWLAPAADITAGNWELITERTRRAMARIAG
jgi:2-dehydro-3-deoxyphosphogluconate aldolase/(4S)-4-hydroxy-2-oxoglutarate aldolase